MYNLNKFTKIMLFIYFAVNVMAYLRILYFNELIGDFVGFKFDLISLNFSLLLILLSCYLSVKIAFIFYKNINFKREIYRFNYQNTTGFLIFFIQCFFILYFISSGTRVAGSNYRDPSIWSIFWVLLPADSLFLIYYALTEKRSFIYFLNLFTAVLSNIIRGWSGIFFIIGYFEFYNYISKNKNLNIYIISFLIILILILYPFIFLFKLFLRDYISTGFTIGNLLMAFTQTLDFIFETSFSVIYSDYSLFSLIDRLQLVANLTGIIDNLNGISSYLGADQFYPFWMDGLHGIAFDRILGFAPRESLGSALGYLISNDQSASLSWVVNSSLTAWLFIDPLLSPLFILYITILIFFCAYICKYIIDSDKSINLVIFTCFFYLIPGWLMVFNTMLYSFIIFILLVKFSKLIK
ncbi:oligosaccharide repeat unit polymerase [Polynucleobacter paneuropaeus]|nr:oligosaccharide repeat unit polymerase [Polynucleobacter paneuropaeus]